MKKSLVLCTGLCIALAFTSCRSKESAYRKAYDKSLANNVGNTAENIEENTPVVIPMTDQPVTDVQVQDNYDNVPVRSEDLTVVDGAGLRAYSVVVGSFTQKSNADAVVRQLRNAGYDAQIAYNSSRGFYRVVAATFDNKNDAVRSRNNFRNNYPDAWLLFNQR